MRATRAAVSARRGRLPNETGCQPLLCAWLDSAAVKPPSGPISRCTASGAGCCWKTSAMRCSGSAGEAIRRRARGGIGSASRSLSATGGSISGGYSRRDCSAASSARRRQRDRRDGCDNCASPAAARLRVRSDQTGRIAAAPSSVAFSIRKS